ncbi:hypothetical protein FA13DRAFT_1731631 [Coprinellus micaceus]|uniref:Protein kinase domain-containing protein n=1 Tax=Coprinellus micaceus TaxID=71717 RepID=A0A4Y7TER3_COPMI|nr:hypothetical protein FA13DRAFT_1731631 [Coprinellus micaceus]
MGSSTPESVIDTAMSTLRAFNRSPVPNELSQWICDAVDVSNPEKRGQVWLNTWSRWKSLAPFFVSHGLYLYDYTSDVDRGASPPGVPKARHSTSEQPPWARRAYNQEEDLDFDCLETVRIWPARDADGHEVIIRLVSGPNPSEELKIFLRLNTPDARKDPRNHTLPVLKYLTFNKLIFVVLPRWDTVAHSPWVTSNTGLEFLHEKRIAHRDIHPSNTVMNVLATPGEELNELRASGSVHYAFIDFDSSIAFPENADLSTLRVQRLMRNPVLYMGLKPGLCDPFKDDVLCLTATTQTMVRVIENVVPEVGLFFDKILHCTYDDVPSALQALQSFRRWRAGVTHDQQREPPGGSFWKGRTRK